MTSIIQLMFERIIPDDREKRIRKWASDNAYMLVTITIFFVITWAFILVDIFVGVTR